MSVNVFGLSGNKTKSAVTKKDLDSKFINLTKNLQLKVDKTGDTFSGNLSVSDHKITDLADPILDNDACNKKFVKSELKADSIITKLYIDTMLHTKLDKTIAEDLNMKRHKIIGVENPTNDDEVCNKKYLDSKITQESVSVKLYIDGLLKHLENRLNLFDAQKDDLTAGTVFDIGAVINTLLRENGLTIQQFLKCFNAAGKMYEKCMAIFGEKTSDIISDIIKSSVLYTDLKAAIIKVIEVLPRNIFMELKVKLMEEDLLSTPEEKTLRKRYRRFINGASEIIDPQRTNEALELLIQKNLLLIDLGYIYIL